MSFFLILLHHTTGVDGLKTPIPLVAPATQCCVEGISG